MIYFYLGVKMENQINVGDQNTQQIGQKPVSQPVQIPEKPVNYWMISTIVLVVVLVGLLFWFYTQNKVLPTEVLDRGQQPTSSPSPTNQTVNEADMPKLAVFMRGGMIYLKNFGTNQETKVSKTTKVSSPSLSPNGEYVAYFSIIHAAGGFPRGDVFISDINGSLEKKLGSTNEFASKITWSKDGNYLGLILFEDEYPSSLNFYAEALLYDATKPKDIARSRINLGQDLSNDQYDVNIDCTKLEAKYIIFCNEFIAVAKTKQPFPELGYKIDQYRNSSFTKPGYKLSKSYKIANDLVVLEFYTGEPRNPEAQWGIGGGIFLPGYDEGVTQTYTVLLNEKTNKEVIEILNAVDTKFLF